MKLVADIYWFDEGSFEHPFNLCRWLIQIHRIDSLFFVNKFVLPGDMIETLFYIIKEFHAINIYYNHVSKNINRKKPD